MTARRVSLTQFGQIVTTLDPRLRAAIVRGLRATAARLVGLVVEEIDHASPHPAVDTGGLRNSVEMQTVPDGSIVQVTAPHAGPIEYGTRPFRPPTEPLAEWAMRKGLAIDEAEAERIAFAVANVIAERGIEPRHFMAKAWDRLPPVLAREVQRALDGEARGR